MTSSSACPPDNQPVLLGLQDAAIGGHEICSFDTNKIGGLPDCPLQLTMLYPVCGVCSYPLIHLVQVYCPLEGSPFHRVFNVFACGRTGCRGNSERTSGQRTKKNCLGWPEPGPLTGTIQERKPRPGRTSLSREGQKEAEPGSGRTTIPGGTKETETKKTARPRRPSESRRKPEVEESRDPAATDSTKRPATFPGEERGLDRWKVLRSQYLDPQVGKKQEFSDLQKEVPSSKDWCEEADDWGINDEAEAQGDTTRHMLTTDTSRVSTTTSEAECTDNFQNLSLSEPGKGLVLPLSCIVLRSHHISVMDEEDYTGCVDVNHAQKLLKEYQQREGVDVEQLVSESFSAKGDQEKYEKSEIKTRDLVFHQFKKRISVCQEQILRYSWKGQPLFITSPPTSFPDVVPRCGVCGSGRVFEFQLMPALISILTHLDESLSLEFGTVLVYTCEKSCWPSGQSTPLEEFPFIQEDPDERYFR